MNRRKQIMAISLAAVMATTATGYGVFTKNEKSVIADNTDDKIAIEETMDDIDICTTTGEDKEETVYFVSDANGNIEKTIVSDWLKNKNGEKTISDKSDLKNIENVKSDADYTEKDGEIIWNANGEDIYYQGYTDKKAPVDVSVKYFLDGKEISADKLAGKSGKITIRFEYKNNLTKEINVNGKKYDMYVPFTMISGVALDSEKFSNVEVSSGKVIADGNRFIVIGLGFPGMNDNMNIEKINKDLNKEIDFPEYVEVSADAKDFELGLTLTIGSADFISKLNLSDVTAMEDINTMIDSLVTATGDLKAGTEKIKDGLGTLNTSFVDYKSGFTTLNTGITKVNDGVLQLNDKSGELVDGISAIKTGVDTINEKVNGEGGAVEGAKALADGASQVDAGVNELKNGSTELVNGVSALSSGAKDVEENMLKIKAAFSGTENQIGLTTGSSQVAAGVEKLQSELSGMVTSISKSIEDNNTKISQINAVLSGGVSPSTGQALSTQEIENYKAMLNQLGGANQALTTMLTQMNPEEMNGSLNTLVQGANQVASGISAVSDGVSKLESEGTKKIEEGLSQLNGKVPELTNGIDTLSKGTAQLKEGAAALSNGLNELGGAFENQLKPGCASLYEGGLLFKEAMGTLQDGTKSLVDGSNVLSDATTKVADGINTLYDGSKTLDDGMDKFKKEAVDKIDNFADNELKEIENRADAIAKAASEYTIFTDAADNKSTSVKFIYETAAISK